MRPIENPILPEHRVIFEAHLKRWQERLGLSDWRINMSPRKPPRAMTADVQCFASHRMAKVRLGDDAGALPVTDKLLEGFAVHELLHVLLSPILNEELEGDALAAAEHGVIHVIQKLLTGGVM